jgi:hypothetical protein
MSAYCWFYVGDQAVHQCRIGCVTLYCVRAQPFHVAKTRVSPREHGHLGAPRKQGLHHGKTQSPASAGDQHASALKNFHHVLRDRSAGSAGTVCDRRAEDERADPNGSVRQKNLSIPLPGRIAR